MENPLRGARSFGKRLFDIRAGESARLLSMFLYLLCVLFAYSILRVASRSLFLNKFDIESLPYLQILIAGAGGIVAYFYTKLAVQASLRSAVTWALGISTVCLIAFWWFLRFRWPWLVYAFNIWVSMFSIVTVSQGWLVASNVFDTRQAKRLYGALGMGAVVGACLGSGFISLATKRIGTLNLLWGSIVAVVLAYAAFLLTASLKDVNLAGVRGAEVKGGESFTFRDIPVAIARHRHLQVIIGIMLLMLTMNSMFEYQFSALAKVAHKGDHLTAFLANYQLWLYGIEFVLQFFLTSVMVNSIGVGGTLTVMPIAMASASALTIAFPTLLAAAGARLSEAVTRYTVNRTGLELLYLPLPRELRNRTKAFVDISMDRIGRGFGGIILIILNTLDFDRTRQIAVVTLGAAGLWIYLATRARREYVQTVRKRLEARRLDLTELRVNVKDPVTIALLEQTVASANPRQVSYALSMLAEAPGYDLRPQLIKLARHDSPEVRARVYELARGLKTEDVLDRALTEIWTSKPGEGGSVGPAVRYVLACSSEAHEMTKLFLDYPNWIVAQTALEALQRETVEDFVTLDWLAVNGASPDAHRRSLAALALGVRGDHGTELLFRLLEDSEPEVVDAACRAAASTQNRAYVPSLIRRLADTRLRSAAIEALASHGVRICGTLGDVLGEEDAPTTVRRQIPRVLRLIPDQRSANVLLENIGHTDVSIRTAALRALNGMRQAAPDLDYGAPVVARQVLQEARHYFELHAALSPLAEHRCPKTAACLLVRTIEDRLRQTLERLFRLLGLRYQPQQMHAAYRAVASRRTDDFAAALEFLDNVMDRELKRVILPLLDAAPLEAGRDLFGIEPLDAHAAVRGLIRSGDPWLKVCSIAAAAEFRFADLKDSITSAGELAGREVAAVARAAAAALGRGEA